MLVGQNKAFNRVDAILSIFCASEAKIKPHFWLAGPSGSGKTKLISTLCHRNDIAMVTVNAAQITKEGTSGNSLSKALSPLGNKSGLNVVCLVDEADKLFISGDHNELAHEITLGVQNEFLKVLEGETATVYGDYGKYIDIDIKRVLFIFAGAWNNAEAVDIDFLRDRGVKTEFLGRVPIVISTQKLSLEALYEILETEQILQDYLNLFPNSNREHVISVIKKHMAESYQYNTLGARQIHSFIHQYFINGGHLTEETVHKSSFNKTLSLKPLDD